MRLEEGVQLLERACEIALREDRVGTMMEEAVRAADRGEVDAALESTRLLRVASPRCADAAVVQGSLLLHEKGQRIPALKSFVQATEQDPGSALALWYVALDQVASGEARAALALLDAAARTQPTDSFAAITLCWVLKAIGNVELATASLHTWLRPGSGRLGCEMLVRLLVCPGEPHLPMLPEQIGKRGIRCVTEFAARPGEAGSEALLPFAFGAAVTAGDGDVGVEGRERCSHLGNPALEGYVRRFGETVARRYTEEFARLILRPELGTATRRLGSAFQQAAGRWRAAGPSPEMVAVPAGRYKIGCRDGRMRHPEKSVSLRPFYIDRYPVTNRQWRDFRPNHTFRRGCEDHPVVNVDFLQATMYARWRGKRLPTEWEWEAAARGPAGRQYAWGACPDPSMANCAERKLRTTTAVTAHPKGGSACGALDMMGNAQEWVDAWDLHGSGLQRRIVKGAGFTVPSAGLVCWHRGFVPPLNKHPNVGFRCAMDA